jgi:hypothetical protein
MRVHYSKKKSLAKLQADARFVLDAEGRMEPTVNIAFATMKQMRDMKLKAARPYLAFLLVWNFAALVAMFDALAYAQHAALVPVAIFAVFAGLFSYFAREWPKLPSRRAAKRSSRRSSTAQPTAR